VPARSLPSALALSYYEPSRDYQVARAQASSVRPVINLQSEELSAVMEAGAARALAETSIARAWAQRETRRLRLPPSRLAVEPGMTLQPPGESTQWRIVSAEADGMAVVVDLQPAYGKVASLTTDPGRSLPSVDTPVAATTLVVAELPAQEDGSADQPMLVAAAASSSSAWRFAPLEIRQGTTVRTTRTASAQAVIGTVGTALPAGQSALFDAIATADVTLTNLEQWLESHDDEALLDGANLAIIGNELIQFGRAIPLAPGRFRLSRFLRGRRGTEWAMDAHRAGEAFILLDPAALVPIPVPASTIGSSITATPAGLGDSGAAPVSLTVSGEALRPPSPVHLRAELAEDGSLTCTWTRRSSFGWAWLDEVDAPLGCSTERYQVSLQGSAASLDIETSSPGITLDPAPLANLGTGAIAISVRQIGDFATSRPVSIQIS
jgi:hypothetical protein